MLLCELALIRIGCRSCMQCELLDANCQSITLFPPQDQNAYRHAALEEIIEERVAPRRPRQNARGVKRKMSSYRQIRSRSPKAAYKPRIQIIK